MNIWCLVVEGVVGLHTPQVLVQGPFVQEDTQCQKDVTASDEDVE
jgi:hypothetical protein